MNALFIAAKEVADFMKARRWKFCVIGGLAVQRWGEPRLTRDADLTLLTGFGEEERFADALLERFQGRRPDARAFALTNRVLLLRASNGKDVDVSFGALNFEVSMLKRATPFEFDVGLVLPTCSAADLFVMKAFAARPQDWLDAEGIAVRQGRSLNRAHILKHLRQHGLVEMQRWFMKIARKQGLLPAVREDAAAYASDSRRGVSPRPDEARRLVYYKNAALPSGPKLALLCSVKCPGKLILDTYDLCQGLRQLGVIVISGFHSPMEQECLRILLRSPHPVIWCLARGMLKTVPAELRPAVNEGRLVIVSPFPDKVRHVTAKTAMTRNRVVAEIAAAVVVAHAAPGSKMETLCRELLAAGTPLYTFDHPANAALLHAGAATITPDIDWGNRLRQKT